VLCDRKREAEGVDFLEGVGAYEGGIDLTGDRDERYRIRTGIGDRRQQVHGPRTARGDAHAGNARRP